MVEVLPVNSISDAEARLKALEIEQSFCVSAPAGSGKTELLIQRILKLLAVVEEPERVVAITFTRKAAAEMRERLQAALEEASRVESGQLDINTVSPHRRMTLELAGHTLRHSRERQWQLDYNALRLKIQTFDGLCNAISNSEPLASRMGGGLQPTDNAGSLYQAAVEQYFYELKLTSAHSKSDSSHSAQAEDLSQLLQYFYNRQPAVKGLLVNMLSLREHWLPHVNTLIESQNGGPHIKGGFNDSTQQVSTPLWEHLAWVMNATISETLQELHRHFCNAKTVSTDNLIEIIDYARQNFEKNNYQDLKANSALASLQDFPSGTLPSTDASSLLSWSAIAELFFTRELTARKQLTKAQGFPANSQFKGEALERHKLKKLQLAELATSLAEDGLITATLARALALPIAGFSQSDQALLINIARCLQRLSAYLQLQFLESGQCDHAEVQAAALRALGTDSSAQAQDLEYRWHRTIEHLLVDEFQDTSVSQYKLIETLTRSWDAADLSNGKRSLFLVGDGMQSIYGFREANVGLFLRAAETGIGHITLKQLRLTQNFRSTDSIVNWVNALFSKTFPSQANAAIGAVPYQVSYSSSPPKENDYGVGLEIVAEDSRIEDSTERAEEARLREAHCIAAKAVQLRQSDPEGSIAVLLRNRSHARFLIDAFQEAGVEWQGVDLAPLKSRESVLDILSLYRAVTNMADDIAWWALARAPWCGLLLRDMQVLADHFATDTRFTSMAELLIESSTADIKSITGLSDDACLRLQFLAAAIQQYWRNRARQPLRKNLHALWLRLGGKLAVSASALDGQLNLERGALHDDSDSADVLFALIEQHEQERLVQSGSKSSVSLEDRLDKLYAQPSETTGTPNNAVQIMTMHKSKGLEFDSVILPGLARRTRRSDAPILYSREIIFDGGEGVLIAPKTDQPLFASAFAKRSFAKGHGRGGSEKGVYDFLKYLDSESSSFERERLLYVAATRAKKNLILSATLCCDASESISAPSLDELSNPIKGSLLYNAWPYVKSFPEASMTLTLNTAQQEPEAKPPTQKLVDLEEQSLAIRRFDQQTVQALLDAMREVASDDRVDFIQSESALSEPLDDPLLIEDKIGASTARDLYGDGDWRRMAGIVFHEMMMYMGQDQSGKIVAHWQGTPQERERVCQHFLRRACLSNQVTLGDDDHQLAQLQISQALENILTQPNGQWLMDVSHQERLCESMVSWKEGEQWRESRIDLSFVDEDEVQWIVDFKLIDKSDSNDARILQSYRPQLLQYQSLLRNAGSKFGQESRAKREIKMALYLPLSDKLLILNEN